jgi:hypothetical protein
VVRSAFKVTFFSKVLYSVGLRCLQRVIVEYRGEEHPFLVTRSLTFEQLLEDAARHFNLDSTEFELQDDSHCTIPLSGRKSFVFEKCVQFTKKTFALIILFSSKCL